MSDMVKIGSLLPQGIVLRIGQWFKNAEGETLVKDVAVHTIAGTRQHLGFAPGGLHEEGAEVPYTEIPAEHWDSWLDANKDSDLVKSGAVFKCKDEDEKDGEPAEAHESEGVEEPHPHNEVDAPQPVPSPVLDTAYTDFKDHAGQEDDATLRGKTKAEMDEPKSGLAAVAPPVAAPASAAPAAK